MTQNHKQMCSMMQGCLQLHSTYLIIDLADICRLSFHETENNPADFWLYDLNQSLGQVFGNLSTNIYITCRSIIQQMTENLAYLSRASVFWMIGAATGFFSRKWVLPTTIVESVTGGLPDLYKNTFQFELTKIE